MTALLAFAQRDLSLSLSLSFKTNAGRSLRCALPGDGCYAAPQRGRQRRACCVVCVCASRFRVLCAARHSDSVPSRHPKHSVADDPPGDWSIACSGAARSGGCTSTVSTVRCSGCSTSPKPNIIMRTAVARACGGPGVSRRPGRHTLVGGEGLAAGGRALTVLGEHAALLERRLRLVLR